MSWAKHKKFWLILRAADNFWKLLKVYLLPHLGRARIIGRSRC